jgi:hypothetical protein
MSIIRAILNNGFFFIVLIVGAALYLAYSDNIKRDHGLLPEEPKTIAESTEHKAIPASGKTEKQKVAETAIEPIVDQHELTVDTPKSAPDTKEAEAATIVQTEINIEEVPATENPANTPQQIVVTAASEQFEETIEIPAKSTDDTVKTDAKTKIEQTSDAVNTAEKSANKDNENQILTSELDSILDDGNIKVSTPSFDNQTDAVNAAREAASKKDYMTAAKIYIETVKKQPSANLVGELAQTLYKADKKEWAAKAWLESAKMLVAENRFAEAAMLSSRLAPIAPAEAREIQMNLQKIQQARMAQKYAAMREHMAKQQQMKQKNMPQMAQVTPQNVQTMPPMQPMANYQYAPMKPMPPMQPMTNYQYAPIESMPPMQPMAPQQYTPMRPMAPVQPTAQMIEMQKAQQARYQAYLEYIRKQQQMLPQNMRPMPMPPQANIGAPAQ